MSDTPYIRRARPSDRSAVLSLRSASAGGGDTPDGTDTDEARVIEALLDEAVPDLDRLITAGRYFVAEAIEGPDRRVVAGAGWAPQDSLGGVAFIRGLAVDAAHCEPGTIIRLVEVAEDAAVTAGYDLLLAPVPADVMPLFETLGYRATGAVEIELAAGRRLHRRKMWKHAA